MKKVQIFFAILSFSLIWVACRKSGNDITPPPAARKLKTLTNSYDSGTPSMESYTYDSEGRLATVTQASRFYSFSYPEAGKLLVTKQQLPGNTFSGTIEGTFNPTGTIASLVYKGETGLVEYTYDFTYDAAGYLTVVKGSTLNESYEEHFTIMNGDVVSSKTYSNGVLSYNNQYTYDLTRSNKYPAPYWYIWPSETWFGKKSTHVINEYKRMNPAGAITWHTKSQFDFDVQLYPLKQTTQYLHSGKSAVTDYTYY